MKWMGIVRIAWDRSGRNWMKKVGLGVFASPLWGGSGIPYIMKVVTWKGTSLCNVKNVICKM